MERFDTQISLVVDYHLEIIVNLCNAEHPKYLRRTLCVDCQAKEYLLDVDVDSLAIGKETIMSLPLHFHCLAYCTNEIQMYGSYNLIYKYSVVFQTVFRQRFGLGLG